MLAETWALLILTLLEIILSIDNLIFISLAIDRVPNALRERVRIVGFALALQMRFVTLFFTSYILSMQKPIFYAASFNISVKDLLMIAGGLFLIIKSFIELWNDIFSRKQVEKKIDIKSQLLLAVLQIILIDLVFSVDSLLTAIALTHSMVIIAIACVFSILAMIFLSSYTAQLIKSSSSLKIIAILFIVLVGVHLMLDGLHVELPKEYLYSSLTFALFVEVTSSIKKKVRCIKKKKQF
ncbi:TerC family protein [Wolbachia endosymbiont of Brugia malayi]|uniref:TerC family protein n=1 Tax=Wolbachia endosymbiont of Brugia malayi TaxID=80849 RepID=UPI00004C93C6|nr:TerC family protein [Wolbachia endosymbiont of Brugia malayi]AAW71030.1 Membrane protein TerC, possibly involved in tellurium resistance [Wolbachia endosymbiont strain TRS of Brugia malayi]QCB61976.1 TerC family protein [Wolbachia endosymbiont of Brugia malayi]